MRTSPARASARSHAMVLALAAVCCIAPSLGAQGGVTTEGAPFLLIPVGARALGMGQAVVAEQNGAESVWWNPAGLARADQREVAVHHYETFAGKGNAVSFLYPSSKLGVLAASIYILDYGDIGTADRGGGAGGSLLPRNLVYAATYSTTVGAHVNAGITFKLVQFRVDCSGDCTSVPAAGSNAATTAVDIGGQYDMSPVVPITFGVVVRHLGPRLQVNDREQADPLPTRLEVGVAYRASSIDQYVKDAELRLTGDLIDRLQFSSPSPRLGASLTYQKRYHFRTGYVVDRANASGASLGVGLTAGGLNLDLARMFENTSGVGQAPVYVSLRYLF
ncbi:MAG: PorV/PorQ family protein [Gemmatimonadaceae bacterium]